MKLSSSQSLAKISLNKDLKNPQIYSWKMEKSKTLKFNSSDQLSSKLSTIKIKKIKSKLKSQKIKKRILKLTFKNLSKITFKNTLNLQLKYN